MKKLIEKIKSNKKYYYPTVVVLVMLIGVTFAYVVDQISGGALSRVFITADTADKLEFEVDKDIVIHPTQFNFVEGGESLSDSAIATARLRANSTNNTASYRYNVYFLISKNEYIYTTTDKKPEMLLQVTNPNGETVTNIKGLKYHDDLQGFDITDLESLVSIAENYEITSNSSVNFTEQNWTIKVSFVNLDSNQIDNEGKTLEGKILIQRNIEYRKDISFFSADYEPAHITNTTVECNNVTGIWNSKYGRLEISKLSGKSPSCNLSSNDSTETKNYLNNYIKSLSDSYQGNGKVIHETFIDPAYDLGEFLDFNEYLDLSIYSSNYYALTSGTDASNSFSYSDNEWSSNIESMKSSTYYNVSFSVPEDGYYQFCYNISKASSNRLFLYNGSTEIVLNTDDYNGYVFSSLDSEVNACVNLDYYSKGSNIRIVQYAYSNSKSPIAKISFKFKKTNSGKNIDTGYRYEGKNPNNYVKFNNELWRIIGVFENEGEYLTKIVRNDTIGSLIYNHNLQNDYSESSLMKLLNGDYLNSENGTESDYCCKYHNPWGGTISLKSNCDYRTNGIKNVYKSMIKDTVWYLGGLHYKSTPKDLYNSERSDDVYIGNSTTWRGSVGLMYPSDFAYSVLATSCPRTARQDFDGYNTENCSGQSWLFGQGDEWLLNAPANSNGSGSLIYNFGFVGIDTSIGDGMNVRPTVYLKESVYIKNGDGSINNPYILEM